MVFLKNIFKRNPPPAAPSSDFPFSSGMMLGSISSAITFNREKTPGELGAPLEIIPDYYSLRLRAYEANLTQDTVKIITNKYFKWTIGNGLKLQAEPMDDFLSFRGVNTDWQSIRKQIEYSFSLYCSLKNSDYSGMKNFHELGLDAYTDSFLGGDCLVIYRIENGYPVAQVIDGQHVGSPDIFSVFHAEVKSRGNRIEHGIELDKKGKHIAFFVRSLGDNGIIEYKRIPAYVDGFNLVMAKMIYFGKHRLNHVRGVSALSAILEKVDKLDRYTEASVASAEERAKIIMAIEHEEHSTGENPLLGGAKKALGNTSPESGKNEATILGGEIERYVSRTTSKTTINMPNGSKLKALESRNEINYDVFFHAIFSQVAAALDMPPEVALQKFDSNYSASRAAMKVWEYMVKIDRNRFANEFYKPFYDLYFYCEVLRGHISAPGFITACDSNDFMIVNAYTKSRFEGVNMPHIDPVKEVRAIRDMLGEKWKNIPLISFDQATEQLNQGDFEENIKNFTEEVNENNLDLYSDEREAN